MQRILGIETDFRLAYLASSFALSGLEMMIEADSDGVALSGSLAAIQAGKTCRTPNTYVPVSLLPEI